MDADWPHAARLKVQAQAACERAPSWLALGGLSIGIALQGSCQQLMRRCDGHREAPGTRGCVRARCNRAPLSNIPSSQAISPGSLRRHTECESGRAKDLWKLNSFRFFSKDAAAAGAAMPPRARQRPLLKIGCELPLHSAAPTSRVHTPRFDLPEQHRTSGPRCVVAVSAIGSAAAVSPPFLAAPAGTSQRQVVRQALILAYRLRGDSSRS